MNISDEVWAEAKKRGLDWTCTGGGFDFVNRSIKDSEHLRCDLTLSNNDGMSPKTLDEECCVGVAFHSLGFVSVCIPFGNVRDALDFMQKTKGVSFLPDIYEQGKKQNHGLG